jgi:hypothetical protein
VSKIVVSQFISVDGVVEDPGGVEGFDCGGWALRFERGPEGNRFKLDEVMASEALLAEREAVAVRATRDERHGARGQVEAVLAPAGAP